MKIETAQEAIRDVYQGDYQITQFVNADDSVSYTIILQPMSQAPITYGYGKTLAEAVEDVVQKVKGMISVPQTVRELYELNDEFRNLFLKTEETKEETISKMMAKVIDIKDCTS